MFQLPRTVLISTELDPILMHSYLVVVDNNPRTAKSRTITFGGYIIYYNDLSIL